MSDSMKKILEEMRDWDEAIPAEFGNEWADRIEVQIQALIDAAHDECALVVLSDTQRPYQPYSVAKEIRSRIGKPLEKKP